MWWILIFALAALAFALVLVFFTGPKHETQEPPEAAVSNIAGADETSDPQTVAESVVFLKSLPPVVYNNDDDLEEASNDVLTSSVGTVVLTTPEIENSYGIIRKYYNDNFGGSFVAQKARMFAKISNAASAPSGSKRSKALKNAKSVDEHIVRTVRLFGAVAYGKQNIPFGELREEYANMVSTIEAFADTEDPDTSAEGIKTAVVEIKKIANDDMGDPIDPDLALRTMRYCSTLYYTNTVPI